MDLLEVSRLTLKRSRLRKRFFQDRVESELILDDRLGQLLTKSAWLICRAVTDRLDVVQQSELTSLLRRLRETFPLTHLAITEDLAAANHLGDTIGVPYQGRLPEAGTVETIVNRPGHAYTSFLVTCSR